MAVYEYHNSQLRSIVVVLQWYRVSVCAELPLICYSIVVRIWQQLLLFSNKALLLCAIAMPYVVVRGRTVILVPRYGVYDPRRNKPTELIAYSSRAQRLKLYYTYNYYILSKFQDFRVVQNTSTVTSYPYYPKGTTIHYSTYMQTKLIYSRIGHCLSSHLCLRTTMTCIF